jgi:hypothetical protein
MATTASEVINNAEQIVEQLKQEEQRLEQLKQEVDEQQEEIDQDIEKEVEPEVVEPEVEQAVEPEIKANSDFKEPNIQDLLSVASDLIRPSNVQINELENQPNIQDSNVEADLMTPSNIQSLTENIIKALTEGNEIFSKTIGKTQQFDISKTIGKTQQFDISKLLEAAAQLFINNRTIEQYLILSFYIEPNKTPQSNDPFLIMPSPSPIPGPSPSPLSLVSSNPLTIINVLLDDYVKMWGVIDVFTRDDDSKTFFNKTLSRKKSGNIGFYLDVILKPDKTLYGLKIHEERPTESKEQIQSLLEAATSLISTLPEQPLELHSNTTIQNKPYVIQEIIGNGEFIITDKECAQSLDNEKYNECLSNHTFEYNSGENIVKPIEPIVVAKSQTIPMAVSEPISNPVVIDEIIKQFINIYQNVYQNPLESEPKSNYEIMGDLTNRINFYDFKNENKPIEYVYTIGDGNCLIHSILTSTSEAYNKIKYEKGKDQSPKHHIGVMFRIWLANYLMANPNIYVPYLMCDGQNLEFYKEYLYGLRIEPSGKPKISDDSYPLDRPLNNYFLTNTDASNNHTIMLSEMTTIHFFNRLRRNDLLDGDIHMIATVCNINIMALAMGKDRFSFYPEQHIDGSPYIATYNTGNHYNAVRFGNAFTIDNATGKAMRDKTVSDLPNTRTCDYTIYSAKLGEPGYNIGYLQKNDGLKYAIMDVEYDENTNQCNMVKILAKVPFLEIGTEKNGKKITEHDKKPNFIQITSIQDLQQNYKIINYNDFMSQ